MIAATVEYIANFFDKINKALGLLVEFDYQIKDKGRFPIYREEGKLVVVPEFFNHPDLRDNVRVVMMAELYSCTYLDKDGDGVIDINPGFMAKGICDIFGVQFIGEDGIEKNLRDVRRKLYDDIVNGCLFDIGQKLRESTFKSYNVTAITRNGPEETIITVKPVGYNLGKPEIQLTEEELYNRCCNYRNLESEKVDMRRNLFVVSGPSGVGKDTVVKTLLKKHPEINKTVSVTTRDKRSNEIEGVDYYYHSKKEFYDYILNEELVEYELYDGAYYGTLYSEVERHPEDVPLVLVIDVRGRRSVLKRYPMAKSIFISPPSFETLKDRIIARNENTTDELEHRLKTSKDELELSSVYDYVIVNDDVESCESKIAEIIEKCRCG